MHQPFSRWTPPHDFHLGNEAGERGARAVLLLTLVTMMVEITAGLWFNSMALLADGWHMSSHALAIGLSAFAYAAARRYAADSRFVFGTWKIEVLAGFVSALMLLGVAALMVYGSVERLVAPLPIRYNEAIAIAVLGLVVNVVSARLLHEGHHHHHDDARGHHHDLNIRSAYLHVIADAVTSLLAIAALLGGKFFAWAWLDPVMGLVGAVLVSVWAVGLLRESGSALLDRVSDEQLVEAVRQRVAGWPEETSLTDLHIWRVGASRHAVVMTLVTDSADLTPDEVRMRLSDLPQLYHLTIEINHCSP